jgi:hypothetical protein
VRSSNCIIYPEGIQLIQSLGIEEKVKRLQRQYALPSYGSLMQDDLPTIVRALNQRGVFNGAPQEYLDQLNRAFQSSPFWSVDGQPEKLELEDFLLFLGEYPHILFGNEFWTRPNLSRFIGTVSAFMISAPRSRPGYTWLSQRNGQTVEIEVTGTDHGDLYISEKDRTPYTTLDPFGNPTYFRPERDKDHVGGLYSCHSIESHFLALVLKYMEQLGSPLTKVIAGEFISWGESLGSGGGPWGESFGSQGLDPELLFTCFDECRIPEFHGTDRGFYSVPTDGDSSYKMFVDGQDLVFSFDRKSIRARFIPEDAPQLVRGLIYQSAKGQGRTNPKELYEALRYRVH